MNLLPALPRTIASLFSYHMISWILAIAMFVGFFLKFLVLNPLLLGCRRFMLANLSNKPNFGNEIGNGFKPYEKVVLTLFLTDLYTFLWMLLFIIPAIVKVYSYRLVPYILVEHPEMSAQDIITLSRRMMDGNKMDTFILDISFIGWLILDVFTLGILGIFYVNPYIMSTHAALYDRIRNEYEGRTCSENVINSSYEEI